MLKKLFLLTMLAPAAAAAQGVSRVDPRLVLARRFALAAQAAAGRAARADAALGSLAARAGVAPLSVSADGSVWLRTLARVAPGGESALEAAGARLGVRAGDVVTALVPADALDRVALLPALVYLEAAAELRSGLELPRTTSPAGPAAATAPENDAGVDQVDVAQLRQREGERYLGLAGQGVVVGIYDSGLDLAHADFATTAGTRVRWAWDQTAAGPGPGRVGSGNYGFGRECTPADIRAGACPVRDRVGHGTHVAGTAAGTGAGTGKGLPAYRFAGVAPAADLVIVKGGDAAFTSDNLVNGVAYIFDRAAQLGEPAVVNLSMSTQDGPHDGSTNFERALDALTGPGRLLAAAAGNEATNADESPAFVRAPVHAGGTLATGLEAAVDVVVPQYTPVTGANNDGAILELWYDGRDSLTIVVNTPTSNEVRIATGDTAFVRTPRGAVVVDNASTGPNPNNGAREAVIALVDADEAAPPAAGAWRIHVVGTRVNGGGRWDMWLVGSTMRSPIQPTWLDGPPVSNQRLVSAPGSASRAITVAAWAGRHNWTSPGGVQQTFPFQERLGDIAMFSNPGPRRDGVLKPEIAAPGKVVLSAMSRDALATWAALPTYVEQDSAHAVLMGTSMATPFVTGALALLLQLRPTLTPDDARQLLAASAQQDAFTLHPYTGEPDGSPNAQWGYGKLDVAAAVHRLVTRAGTLRMDVVPGQTTTAVSSPAGARVELLRLRLTADSAEAQQVVRMGFDVAGRDTAAQLLVMEAAPPAGAAPAVISRAPVRLDGAPVHVTLAGPVVPAGATREYVVAVQLGTGVANGTRFSATWRPEELATRGTLSGEEHRSAPGGPVASPVRPTTVLAEGETVNLSENPIRTPPLVVNYAERPRAIYVYSVAGARIRTLTGAQLEDGRALWSLDNDRGDPVASGIYLLVLDAPSGPIVRKVFVRR